MSNDNNLLLIILIGIVMFWICNINTTEKFENNDSKRKNSQNKNSQSIEFYRSDKNNESNADSERARSPLLGQQDVDDSALIDKLYAQKQSSSPSIRSTSGGSKSVSGSSSRRMMYANGVPTDPNQKILQTPPTRQNNSNLESSYQEMAQPFNAQQEMYQSDNPVGPKDAKSQNPYYNFADESYLLLPKNSMPDEKFKKVMPAQSRQTLSSAQLLPTEKNADWFQVPNEKFNLLQAVDLEIPEIKIGIDTVGQSRKNATYDLRSAPPNPKFVVSPWQNSTIEPDYNTKPLC
jgi:hypothetical protein